MKKIAILYGKDVDERELVEEKCKEIGADSNFIQLVLRWYGWRSEIFPIGSISETEKKRIKRRFQVSGQYSKDGWKTILKDFRNFKNTKLKKTLFWMHPIPPNPKHRPRDIDKLKIVHILRIYFTELTTKLQMELIAWILGIESDSLAQEWSRRRDEVLPSEKGVISVDENGKSKMVTKPFSPEDEYKMLKGWYLVNKKRIAEAIRTGIPIYQRDKKTV